MDEFTGTKTAYMGKHHGEQRVTGEIKRDSQKNIGATLIQLACQRAVGDLKLKHDVTWRQLHVINHADIPRGNDTAA